MTTEILRANFTISPAARAAIKQVRQDYDAQLGDDPAAVLSVAWGLFSHQSGHPRWENVVISFILVPCWLRSRTEFRKFRA